jgi:hypothetical protein
VNAAKLDVDLTFRTADTCAELAAEPFGDLGNFRLQLAHLRLYILEASADVGHLTEIGWGIF